MSKMTKRALFLAAAMALPAIGCVVDNPAPGLDGGADSGADTDADTDADSDSDTDADAGEDAGTYLACDENGDICHFNADGDPIGIAEDCPDQHSLCLETDGGAPECQCIEHFDMETECAGCETGYGGAACAVCEIGYGGAACDECVDPYVFADGECLYGAMCGSDSLWLAEGDLPGATRPDEELAVGGTPSQGTTIDLVTGLEWQRCPIGTTADGETCSGGPAELVSFSLATAHCTAPFGGYDDWRLPEVSELQSLLDYSDTQMHININYFWILGSEVWSSTEVPGSEAEHFGVDYSLPDTAPPADDLAYGVCVRSTDPADTYPKRFALVAADGSTAIDLWTQREWRRCIYGQTWEGTSCSGEPVLYDPSDVPDSGADAPCGDGYAGHGDWRVPDPAEMASLLAWCDEERPYFTEAFAASLAVDEQSDMYWTSTSYPASEYIFAFDLSARGAFVQSLSLSETLPVLCVRDPD